MRFKFLFGLLELGRLLHGFIELGLGLLDDLTLLLVAGGFRLGTFLLGGPGAGKGLLRAFFGSVGLGVHVGLECLDLAPHLVVCGDHLIESGEMIVGQHVFGKLFRRYGANRLGLALAGELLPGLIGVHHVEHAPPALVGHLDLGVEVGCGFKGRLQRFYVGL